MNDATQRPWQDAQHEHNAHLAVYSPGLHPKLLAHARRACPLGGAARRCATDAALRAVLLLVALHDVNVADAPRMITALPKTPQGACAFFMIASAYRHPDIMPRTIRGRPAGDPGAPGRA